MTQTEWRSIQAQVMQGKDKACATNEGGHGIEPVDTDASFYNNIDITEFYHEVFYVCGQHHNPSSLEVQENCLQEVLVLSGAMS